MARAIASLVWTSVRGGSVLLAKLLWHTRRAKSQVRKGARSFYKTLVKAGLPEEEAAKITQAYAAPALELLKIRNLIKMVREMD